ncbi:MAG: glycosyltransferase family 2 protein [Candidatus Cloacimonadota bacterium]|nr:glycosyltransferase family 2 protein [Candidatus Cloacimonadota bacterium]
MDFQGKLSIIIPCYNEEKIINQAHKRVLSALEKLDVDFEIIYINDGSDDRTLEILQHLAKSKNEIKIISFSRNFGHQPAVSAGIKYCSGDVAIIIDADMQDPPELFPELLEKYQQENCNVVYCVRKKRIGENFFKKITAKLFYKMLKNYSDISIPQDTGDFRLIDRKVITEFKKLKEKNKFIRGLIFWLGFKQVPFYYTREKREAGETKYPLKKMISFALTGLTYFTNKPLYQLLKFGMIILSIGFIFLIFLLFINFSQILSDNQTSMILISAIIILSGINLISMGILGIYISNIFKELKSRPEFVVERTINIPEDKNI